MRLNVYVPAIGTFARATIDDGSGIVGSPADDEGRLTIDYEGNRYGAENLRTYEARVAHAADRHVTKYPTVARMSCEADDLILVGTYDTESCQLVFELEGLGALHRWAKLDD